MRHLNSPPLILEVHLFIKKYCVFVARLSTGVYNVCLELNSEVLEPYILFLNDAGISSNFD